MQTRVNRRIKRISERRRAAANRRWELDRQRRDLLAKQSTFTGRIVRRIIVIDDETKVRETIIYDFDSYYSASKKCNAVLRNSHKD